MAAVVEFSFVVSIVLDEIIDITSASVGKNTSPSFSS